MECWSDGKKASRIFFHFYITPVLQYSIHSSVKLSWNLGITTFHPNLSVIFSASDADASGSP